MIAAIAGVAFKAIDNGRALMDLDRQTFAVRAAEFLSDLNIIHPFRERNGRAQRILLSAIGEAAGHPIAFDVATRERMVATSIAAANGDLGGFTRLIEEATDVHAPARRPARRGRRAHHLSRLQHHRVPHAGPRPLWRKQDRRAVPGRGAAKEVGHRGVTANSVLPTATDGAGVSPGGARPQVVEYIKRYNPMGRMATVTDVADAVEYLAGPLSGYVSGQHLLLSGGAPA